MTRKPATRDPHKRERAEYRRSIFVLGAAIIASYKMPSGVELRLLHERAGKAADALVEREHGKKGIG